MSQILTNLIFVELQKISPNPIAAAEQRKLAQAVAKAVQTYLVTSAAVVVATPAGPSVGKITAP